MNKQLHSYILPLFLLLLASCANVKAPTGGPSDTTAPQIVSTEPLNYSTNFNANTIAITFDEWVTLSDIKNQLIISPPLNEPYDAVLKKKTLWIYLNETLLPQTTYSFSFGASVKDYNAGNVAENLRYVVSTGDELDSLSLKGKVEDAFSHGKVEGVKIMLYENFEDSVVLEEKPIYFGMTNKEGAFSIDFLKAGSYKAVALQDANDNYLYDEDEAFAWLDEPLNLLDTVQFALSTAPSSMTFVEDYESDSSGFLKFWFNHPLKNIRATALNYNLDGLYYAGEDTCYFSLRGSPTKMAERVVLYNDSSVVDTLETLYFGDLGYRNLGASLKETRMSSHDKPSLQFGRFLSQVDTAKIELWNDSLPLPFELTQKSPMNVEILADLEDGKSYTLNLNPGAFTSRESWKNDSLEWNIQTYKSDYFGSLTLKITGMEQNSTYIFKLENGKGAVVLSNVLEGDTTLTFPRLVPEKYHPILILDQNKDGDWSAGNYWKHFHPEETFYLPEAIQVRSNWVQELEWKMGDKQEEKN